MLKDNQEKTVSAPKKLFILFGLTAIVLIFGLIYAVGRTDAPSGDQSKCNTGPSLDTKVIKAGDQIITAEIALSDQEKTQGLSGRNCLEPGTGMLFVYDLPGDYCYWMKDMKFPIDIIWLDKDQRVVTIKKDTSPDTYPESFCPSDKAQYVIEVDAGQSEKYNWQLGTQFDLEQS